MKEVLKFDIQSNGLLSAMPYIVLILNMVISGMIADRLISKKILSRNNVRRIFNILG